MKQSRSLLRALALVLVLSAVAVLAMYFDAKPVWLGLPIAYLLIACAGLIGGSYAGAATGLLSTAVGIYIKINHYFVPEKLRAIPEGLSGEKLEKLTKQIANFHSSMADYTGMLAAYLAVFILLGVTLGYGSGILGRRLSAVTAAKHTKPTSSLSVKRLTYMSVFIALGVTINSLRIGNVSFSGFPIIYSGFALGPIPGFIVGALTDVIGFLVRPSGNSFNILFTLTSALTGLLPALILTLPGLRNRKKHVVFVYLAILITQGITSVLMVPIFRLWLFDHPLIATMTSAAVKQLYSVPLYTFFYLTIDKALGKNLRPERLNAAL